VEGTSNVSVLLDEGVVTFDIKEKENIEKVKQAIELSGYTVP
jgi:copper chaperone CopZ